MEKPSIEKTVKDYRDYEDRFSGFIIFTAIIFYISVRIISFIYLTNIAENNRSVSVIVEFIFGIKPYSILDILFGFDLNQGLFGLLQPKNLLLVIIQATHFIVSYFLVRIPFVILTKVVNHNRA